jgi:hypothetical protein
MWAATLPLCGQHMWVDYATPQSRHWVHLPYQGPQHSDLLPAAHPRQHVADRLSSAFHRLRQLQQRLQRRSMPDYGHAHALTHLYGELQRLYHSAAVQQPHGQLHCAEPQLLACLRSIHVVYHRLAQAPPTAPLSRRDWQRRVRRLRRADVTQIARQVAGETEMLRQQLQLQLIAEPRRLQF